MDELGEWAWQLYNRAARTRPSDDYTRWVWKIHLAASGTRRKAVPATIKQRKPKQKRLVVATSEMTTETFTIHFTRSHQDSLAGMEELPPDITPEVEEAYRSFHYHLHGARVDYDHEHEEDAPEYAVDRCIEALIDNLRRGWYEIAGTYGFVAVFPQHDPSAELDIATRINGVVKHHATIEEATDRLLTEPQPKPQPVRKAKHNGR
jgi:hypothetical protein